MSVNGGTLWIIGFYKPDGPYGQFSNWYMQNFSDGARVFCCAEQYIMWSKAVLFGDNAMAGIIMSDRDPAEMKRHGRMVRGFDEQIWQNNVWNVAVNAMRYKFGQSAELRNLLVSTGEHILAECSPYDKLWGIGLSLRDNFQNQSRWRGSNILGKALMQVRYEIANGVL